MSCLYSKSSHGVKGWGNVAPTLATRKSALATKSYLLLNLSEQRSQGNLKSKGRQTFPRRDEMQALAYL